MLVGKILCVDDDLTVLTALRAVLSALGPGCSVETAQSGDEALDIEAELRSKGKSLALVIADFIMPGMRGDDLLVRLHARSPETINVMLTGQSDFEGVKNAINHANLYRFIEKPFHNEDIVLTAKSALEAYHQKQELTQQNEQLRRLNRALQETLEQLSHQRDEFARSEARATISTLVASVMHELATPVGLSATTADMLFFSGKSMRTALDAGTLTRHSLNEFVETVNEGSDLLTSNLRRATELMQNFMQMAADQASERRRMFELGLTVKEILAAMSPSLKTKPHRVVMEIPSGIHMNSLPGALGQVIINAINNAYLHAFEGRSHGTVTIRARQELERVHLSVSDDGIGISADDLKRVKEPFFSTKIGRGGTGLGLSIVDNLVHKALCGTLDIHSVVNEGTTLSICIPNDLSATA
jgi:signal transduction histidine kinase